MICEDCGLKFDETDQNYSEQKFGQCPACGSECITEETTWDILLRKARNLIYKVRRKL